jgi:hypothetical protein
LTAPTIECKNSSASEAPNPGRHHVGTPGDIISECPGDFVGIRTKRRPLDAASWWGAGYMVIGTESEFYSATTQDRFQRE